MYLSRSNDMKVSRKLLTKIFSKPASHQSFHERSANDGMQGSSYFEPTELQVRIARYCKTLFCNLARGSLEAFYRRYMYTSTGSCTLLHVHACTLLQVHVHFYRCMYPSDYMHLCCSTLLQLQVPVPVHVPSTGTCTLVAE
jgi:hypothetical protein